MLTQVQELEHKTLLYWRLNSCRRGRSTEQFTVKQGLQISANTLKHMDEHRPLSRRFRRLLEDIIEEPRSRTTG